MWRRLFRQVIPIIRESNQRFLARMPRQNKKGQASSASGTPQTQLPDFNQLLRTFYKRSHPDLLRHSHSSYSEINTLSFQVLNNILEQIQVPNSYPASMKKNLTFYLRDPAQPSIAHAHVLEIHTNGGDCRDLLTKTFQNFFTATQVMKTSTFVWNKEYFPLPSEDMIKATQKEDEERFKREMEEMENERREYEEFRREAKRKAKGSS